MTYLELITYEVTHNVTLRDQNVLWSMGGVQDCRTPDLEALKFQTQQRLSLLRPSHSSTVSNYQLLVTESKGTQEAVLKLSTL